MKQINLLGIFLLALPIISAAPLTIDAPQYMIEAQSYNVNFIVNATLNGTVYLSYNNLNSQTSIVSFTEPQYSWSVQAISPGQYSISAELKDSAGTLIATASKTGTVNSSIPKIISSSPSGVIAKDNPLLILKTNEPANCKYDAENKAYENLAYNFSNTGNANHNTTLSSLSEGDHEYYIKCRDNEGYVMNDPYLVKFKVDILPTATIELSDENPVKAGVIEVSVKVSEELDDAPILEYSFSDEPLEKKRIYLEGSNSDWNGYIVITEEDNNKVGTFHFQGTDSAGNTGTRISSGNIFVVDTAKPIGVQSLKAAAENGIVKLTWYYDGEEAEHFNIYRSTNPGTDYVDFYTQREGNEFIDISTIDKVTYYYRIAAVDKASNQGFLSAEVFATSVNGQQAASSEPDIPKVLPPDLVPRVDTSIRRIDKLLIDVKEAKSQLESAQSEKKSLADELRLPEKVNDAASKLESIRENLQSLKDEYATEEELELKIEGIELEAKKTEKTTPKDIGLLEKSDFTQAIGPDDIEKAANDALNGLSLTEEEKGAYIRKNLREKDRIKVDVSARVAEITYLDNSKSEKSIIRKIVSYNGQEQLKDVVVIETIPKTIASSASEIDFITGQYEIIKDDPVVKFGFLDFSAEGEELKYRIDKRISIEELKNSKTVLLLSQNSIAANKVTGSSIFAKVPFGLKGLDAIFVWIGMLSILGLGSYYMFFVKDYGKNFSGLFSKKQKDGLELPDLPKKRAGYSSDLHELEKSLYEELELAQPGKRSAAEEDGLMLMHAIIDEINSRIDSNNHEGAISLYPRVSQLYQSLPKGAKAEVYQKCQELHRKIHGIKSRIF